MSKDGVRAHSKFSASGAERWMSCSASVELSEGVPDKSSKWAEEGTRAHEVLERMLRTELSGNDGAEVLELSEYLRDIPRDMFQHAMNAAHFILDKWRSLPDAELMVESRVYLDFIDEEAFGTLDSAIIDYFATLHIFDFKYGAGVPVGPVGNLQMIFYALAMANKHHWNFKRVKIWIIQPRISGYDGPLYWEISIKELKSYVPKFREAVRRVREEPELVEGSWCHWCKAKSKCPLKNEKRLDKAIDIFKNNPLIGENYGKEKSQKESDEKESGEVVFKSEADWKKEERRQKAETKKARKAKKEIGDFY